MTKPRRKARKPRNLYQSRNKMFPLASCLVNMRGDYEVSVGIVSISATCTRRLIAWLPRALAWQRQGRK